MRMHGATGSSGGSGTRGEATAAAAAVLAVSLSPSNEAAVRWERPLIKDSEDAGGTGGAGGTAAEGVCKAPGELEGSVAEAVVSTRKGWARGEEGPRAALLP